MKTSILSGKGWFRLALMPIFGLLCVLLLVGCDTQARVGALRTESKSVEQGNAQSVNVEVSFGAGHLQLAGSAEKLMEANFSYNVAKIKPEVRYTDGTLDIRQPDIDGMPALLGITGFRNDWTINLDDSVPMDLSVDAGAGSGELLLAGLSLTRLDINLGAGIYTIDLSGDWANNLDVSIDAGAADVTLLLPKDVGVRVSVEQGPHTIQASGLVKDGAVYTNPAYSVSDVTIQVDLQVGIGMITMGVEEAATSSGSAPITADLFALTHFTLEGTGANQLRYGLKGNELLAGKLTYAA